MFKLPCTPHVGPQGVQQVSGPIPLVGQDNICSMSVAGRDTLCLLDTGSMVTTIASGFYRQHLRPTHPLMPLESFMRVVGAGGQDIPYEGYIELALAENGSQEQLWVPVLVVRDTPYNEKVPMIIGTNVLKAWRGRGFRCTSQALLAAVVSLVGESHAERGVYLSSACLIQPNGTVVAEAELGGRVGLSTGILEPVSSLPAGVVVPPCAVTMNNKRKGFVRLINLTDHEVHLAKKQRVATLVEVTFLDALTCTPADKIASSQQVGVVRVDVDLSSTELNREQKNAVQQLLDGHSTVFARDDVELGSAKGVKHRIRLTDEAPFKERPRRIPPAMYEEVRQHIRDMLAAGAIRKSNSPWSSSVVLVRKKDGRLRLCVDYRKLNARTIRDAYSMPLIEATLDHLSGAKWFSTLDLQAGYWQIPMEEESKAKTAFSVGSLGFFEAERMPFGLTNAPATFQRLMEQTLADLTHTMAYLDDVIVFSETFEEHLERLGAVFQRLEEQGLKLKPSKCHLFRRRVNYLGHVISEQGVEADPAKIEAVKEWPAPTTLQELRAVLGFFGY